MSFISINTCIRCCFGSNGNAIPDKNPTVVEVYFAKTKDISPEFPRLKEYIDNKDILKADLLRFDKDRYTYLFCHTLLRLLLSKKLNTDPGEITFIYNKNNKPGLQGDSLFFNISHTREAFAIAISDRSQVGIDLEKVDRNVDFKSITDNFFSNKEREFILESPGKSRDRFFLLWTRKEALLKALGTGIINKLESVEVFRDVNNLKMKSFENLTDYTIFRDHFIYSLKLQNYFLSLAAPQKVKAILHKLDAETLNTILTLTLALAQ